MSEFYELTEGRPLFVVARFDGHDYVARVLHDVEAAGEWVVTWTDGVNTWIERYEYPWNALARFAALVCAAEQSVLLVHDPGDPHGPLDFVEESERFMARVVHAFNCPAGCRGDGSSHQV
jgi:hypothetical protein